ncbi:C-C motif chemokine 20-like [Paralichthys olivaceus]|uniref:C-C motif chemokine 20-like n=1 Tax=Paralichthys olivaceus TaxID=8255 RepID=UPI00097DCB56|nr:PREDICTED: C-C motif chemokine 20-like [Paralichthys olivaceus]
MAPRGTITMTTALLCFILGLLSPAPATSCCTRYNRKPVPFQRIKGYREQTIKENCHIEAIIFYTIKKNAICVTKRDEWVRKTLELLSSKLKKMSKPNSAGGETLKKKKKKRGNSSFNDGSGSFFSTTATFLNNTESFY